MPTTTVSTDTNIFRWYRSGWGRYTQTDPLDVAASLQLAIADEGDMAAVVTPVFSTAMYEGVGNIFSYSAESPITTIDPDGAAPFRLLGPNQKFTNSGEGRVCGLIIGKKDPLVLHLDYQEYQRGKGAKLHINVTRPSRPDPSKNNRHLDLDWMRRLLKNCKKCSRAPLGPVPPIFLNPCEVNPLLPCGDRNPLDPI